MSFNRAGSRSKEYDRVSLEEFSDDDSNDGNNDFVQSSIKNQQELMKQQDQGLDFLATSVNRLHEMSMGISDELNEQNNMLDAMETDLDEAGEELDMVTRRTKEFIQQAGGTKNCVIIVSLSLIALVLFFLVIYV
mmetsp:Transcript_12158/g.33477  ORF Transcript_12158/g.33477 Transcript_12158/m.33477 type:complete len:135 (-) Transcript_12158:1197-1601(-)|eukprot:CAMPEP_0198108740 /NCGR_PEP_ID=MMETSP1442-20131203/780_1 /TAXON_ID= /ORGANISM="Craspedostauros australis, Strain CCMP3328" /LENGTH=134 /DNA_ID=CAMNT_0043764099 /DNA_START=324 /DNA_END=728 /DNA_ORIENTATION=+